MILLISGLKVDEYDNYSYFRQDILSIRDLLSNKEWKKITSILTMLVIVRGMINGN